MMMKLTNEQLTRRHFIQQSGMLGMGALAGGSRLWRNASPPLTRVVIVREETVIDSSNVVQRSVLQSMLQRGVQALTGDTQIGSAWQAFFHPADRVGVKSNPQGSIHYAPFLNALLNSLAAVGIAEDRMRVWNLNRGAVGREPVEAGGWSWIPGYDAHSISRVVGWADGLLNAPCLKVHSRSGMSGALKNWLGAVTQVNHRDECVAFAVHADQCAGVGQINALPAIRAKCRLIVVDALSPLCREPTPNQPQIRCPFHGLILGTDPVAVDRVGWLVLQECRRQSGFNIGWDEPLPVHIRAAADKYALGTLDLRRIELVYRGKQDSFPTT